MNKRLLWATVAIVSAVAGFVLAMFLRPSPDAPPTGFKRRVVDSFNAKSVVEYYGSRVGNATRIRYLSGPDGLRPLDLGNLSWYISEKHSRMPESREAAIRDFIRLHNHWGTIVLKSAKDIPGFSRNQLDPDLRDLSLAPFDAEVKGKTLSVVYTWTEVGGMLKRYRFKSQPKHAPYCYSCVVLQKEVGDAAYLE